VDQWTFLSEVSFQPSIRGFDHCSIASIAVIFGINLSIDQ